MTEAKYFARLKKILEITAFILLGQMLTSGLYKALELLEMFHTNQKQSRSANGGS